MFATFGAVAGKSTAALQVEGSMPAQTIYLYSLHMYVCLVIVFLGIDASACGCYVCKNTHDTEFKHRVGQGFLK